MALRRAGKGYVLGVKTDHAFNSWVSKPLVAGTAESPCPQRKTTATAPAARQGKLPTKTS
jgi:hypothetical protein